MNVLTGIIAGPIAVKAVRELSHSALPDAPTVPERESTPHLKATRRAVAGVLRWTANRIEPSMAR